jgi:hypothetical protein
LARKAGGAPLSGLIFEPYVCDTLGVTPLDLGALDLDTIYLHLGYYEGQALAEWQAMQHE